ncbi:sulfide/dihydroorotate dehydrogenase-like FAD/NAD-binding protein [Candidatus Woesearchaeota archaeon]|nr:sulfide/dihydroorotate dehydrogenase-like FAD/NAD-binding protein [Candidatus Woesearchaeota archaeon]
MSRVVKKQKIADGTYLLELEAPEIAKKIGPGQFVLIRPKARTEGICLPVGIVKRNTISVVVKGENSKVLASLKSNDHVSDIAGPIGNQTSIEEVENVVFISDSYGIPSIYNIAQAYKDSKVQTYIIIGDKSRKFLYWEDKMKEITNKIVICTEDGSRGHRGTVPSNLRNILSDSQFELAIVAGTPSFMHEVSKFTRQRIKTKAVVNPLMIDPIGLSGTCRIRVDEKIKFATIDGPEFNAHSVDFDELRERIGRGFE